MKILLCLTGSVAAIQCVRLIVQLRQQLGKKICNQVDACGCEQVQIRVIVTEHAKHFLQECRVPFTRILTGTQTADSHSSILLWDELIRACEVRCVCSWPESKMKSIRNDDEWPLACPIAENQDEWQRYSQFSDPILHIQLRDWADLCLIAPLDANTLAKCANGLCDNLMTCVLRAWHPRKTVIACPAMNVAMWEHLLTQEHLNKIKLFGYEIVMPVEKQLACGETGMGAMAEIETIVFAVSKFVS